tara:strand:+ start:725 stop:1105 length:381 start_codon:yes stop_codon:yes gene_type:complete
MSEKYLYFRTEATAANDDARGDSAMYPLSSLQGMHPSADDTLNIFFKPMIPVQHDDQNASVINADYVVVTLSTVNTHKDVIDRLSKLFSNQVHAEGFISVADDQTSKYAVAGIAGLSTISTAAAVS